MRFLHSDKDSNNEIYMNVNEGLRRLYKQKLLPLEKEYKFNEFHSPFLEDADFEAKPMVLLVGQYSTGKTTFLKFILGQDFPGIRIGPEPTTESFTSIMYGENESIVPGNALVVDPSKQFRPLTRFGNAFLNRFQCSQMPSSVLSSISLVDTPGILSGEKQRTDRGYDFTGVLGWFAERADRIILLFDAHKLDISDEFKVAIQAIRSYDEKIRIVLNKADGIDAQQLMRVYGALMWSLGRVLMTPEVPRVYIGSFWDAPLVYDINRSLFDAESSDLFSDLQTLPKTATIRKLNDLIKRARLAKVHAYIISHLKKEMPSMFGREKKQKELVNNLATIYQELQKTYQISIGDFPNLDKLQENLQNEDFTRFEKLKPKLIENVDRMLSEDIAKLMSMISSEDDKKVKNGAPQPPSSIQGGVFARNKESPFGYGRGEGANQGADSLPHEWIINKDKDGYDNAFYSLNPIDGKISGATAKAEMIKSKLPNSILGKIWKLADYDKDGLLDDEEWALSQHLIKLKLDGFDLPTSLPDHLIPPSKRNFNSS